MNRAGREALVAGHLDALHAFALAWTRNGDFAAEVVQRTFLKAFEKLHQLRDPGAARSWLVAILRNEIAHEHRGRMRLVAWDGADFDGLAGEGPADDGVDPSLLAALPAALDQLPDPAREILLLRFQQDLSYEQISELLGLPLGTVQSRLHRAKAALKVLITGMLTAQSAGGVA
jgi:RNA polymerase sigma-70 factor (ECF subfamily)